MNTTEAIVRDAIADVMLIHPDAVSRTSDFAVDLDANHPDLDELADVLSDLLGIDVRVEHLEKCRTVGELIDHCAKMVEV